MPDSADRDAATSSRGHPTPRPESKRALWETRYLERDLKDFFWYREDAPPELVRLMEGPNRPTAGGALDLGCGPGVMSVYLGQYLHPTVGVDIAHAAVLRAQDLAEERNSPARFMVVEAPVLPFRPQAFGLVFDRGCLQAIPRTAWPTYFREIERVLRPGGLLWLYCSTVSRPSLLSKRGLRFMARRMLGRARGSLAEIIQDQLPSSMETLELENRSFTTPAGQTRLLVYGLFRKGGSASPR
jgi:SAM-dependent methyltransferase